MPTAGTSIETVRELAFAVGLIVEEHASLDSEGVVFFALSNDRWANDRKTHPRGVG